ncbi:hypothetical protein LCGC14_2154580 [marine sediment metagenome]|uniref:DUF1064 domain-containing protein n=1 Tax=marine sediment metagenome TaxID=412755 RepID=A0A0F9G7K8_9ZZZZ
MIYSKYRAIKTKYEGITFDSKGECERYKEILMMERAGEVSDIELQPQFILQDRFELHGIKYRNITYRADFMYKEKHNSRKVVEDFKGKPTSDFKLKWKIALFKYGLEYDFRQVFKS